MDDAIGLEAQMQAAFEAVERLLRSGEHDPRHLVLALARVTGELGASAVLAGDVDPGTILGDLADFVHLAGREHARILRDEALPAAGRSRRATAPSATRSGGLRRGRVATCRTASFSRPTGAPRPARTQN